jgi:hypothetical protein
MFLFNRTEGRKAVSEVVTVILMMGIVATAGIIVVQMGFNIMLEGKSTMDTFTGQSGNKIQEKFIVDDVWFYSTGHVNVSVINVGTVPVNITTISFNETDTTLDERVILGEDQSAVVSLEFSWVADGVYKVWVLSERGNVYGSYWKT